MAEPLRHRQTKEAANRYVQPTATAPHLDSTRLGHAGMSALGQLSGVKRTFSPIDAQLAQLLI